MYCNTAAGVLLCAVAAFSQSLPRQIESHSRQAQEYLKTNRPDLAAHEFSAILALDPDNADAHGNMGVLLFFQGDYAQAAPELRAALRLHSGLWKIQALLGMCEKRTGEIPAARSDLEKAFGLLEEEKLRIQTGLELIEIYHAANELDKAAMTVNVLRELRPADPEILYTAQRIYSSLADEAMLGIALAAPRSARMYQLIAHELARQGNTDGAIAQLREAMKLEPRLPGIHFELAEALSAANSAALAEEAKKEYMAALVANPFDEKSICRLGEIAVRAADLKEALARYSRAIELQPDDPDANLGLAKVLLSMDQPAKAQLYLEHSAKLEPFNSVTHYHLAAIYREQGRAEDSRRELNEFKHLRELKRQLTKVYQQMRLELAKKERPDPTVPE